ncbi:MAG: hypothetical protein ACFFBP_12350 [Promethearchaeota archaeon]
MSEQNNNDDNKYSIRIRSIIFILYVLLLFYLFLVFINIGMNAILVMVILIFFLLLMIGPIFYGFKSPFYSRLFQKKSKKVWTEKQKKIDPSKSKTPRPFGTEIKFRKPLIRKCPGCGMTVANFVKKCPQCGTIIMS